MTFKISLEHTHDPLWIAQREKGWGIHCAHLDVALDDEEEKPLRDYYFNGDIDDLLERYHYKGFSTVLFNSPANNLADFQNIFIYYWNWVFEDLETRSFWKNAIPLRNDVTMEEYLVYVCLEIGNWTAYQPAKPLAELFLWVFGDVYEPKRQFPISLGIEKWQPRLEFDPNILAIYLTRGLRSYLFSFKKGRCSYQKYKYLDKYFFSIFKYWDSDYYAKIFFEKNYKSDKNHKIDEDNQYILRWFIAGMEGVVTKREIKKNNREIPHNDIELENKIREGLKKLDLPQEYHDMVSFVHQYGERCLVAEEE